MTFDVIVDFYRNLVHFFCNQSIFLFLPPKEGRHVDLQFIKWKKKIDIKVQLTFTVLSFARSKKCTKHERERKKERRKKSSKRTVTIWGRSSLSHKCIEINIANWTMSYDPHCHTHTRFSNNNNTRVLWGIRLLLSLFFSRSLSLSFFLSLSVSQFHFISNSLALFRPRISMNEW